jgi:hypothetical protein
LPHEFAKIPNVDEIQVDSKNTRQWFGLYLTMSNLCYVKRFHIKALENFLIAKEISFQTHVNELHFLVICVCFIALLASFCDYYC